MVKAAGWVLVAVLVLTAAGLLVWWHRPRPGIDPARIYRACAEYAGLDLAGWAAICRDAGYQQ